MSYYAILIPDASKPWDHELSPRFDTLQELANDCADGWDEPHPKIDNENQMKTWLAQMTPHASLLRVV